MTMTANLRATALVGRAAVKSTLPRRWNNNNDSSAIVRSLARSSSSSLLPFARAAIGANDKKSNGQTQVPPVVPGRQFSTNYPRGLRSYPQYTVFGENCLLSLKTIMPTFRIAPGRSPHLALESAAKRGRIILEWIPRDGVGKTSRDGAVRFALSPEECGFILAQLPKNEPVVLVRRAPVTHENPTPPDSSPDKVVHITPGQAGMVSFKIDFELNGVGGHDPVGHYNTTEASGPLEVVVQAGEFQVMMSLIHASIPQLMGWTTMLDIATQNAVDEALERSSSSSSYSSSSPSSPNRGGGSRFSSSDPGEYQF